jgi:DNA-binding transcriptional regulator YiaG
MTASCGEKIMGEYHFTECGLDNIYLVNGFEITKNNDDEEIFIHDIHGLLKTIGMMLVTKQGLLIGNEIKFIRTTLDLSQTALARSIGCSYQTILLWEKDKTPISNTADRLLRIIFFEYLNPEKNRKIYELINEIADLEAEFASSQQKINKIEFEEISDKWQLVA